jgi:hypothetical protein
MDGPPSGILQHVSYTMAIHRQNSGSQEPIGIVISRGSRDEAVPRFCAYVWAPGPEGDESGATAPTSSKAAA